MVLKYSYFFKERKIGGWNVGAAAQDPSIKATVMGSILFRIRSFVFVSRYINYLALIIRQSAATSSATQYAMLKINRKRGVFSAHMRGTCEAKKRK